MKEKKFAAIVLSAGRGSRMQSDIPKQYMELNGYPVIYYSLKAFQDSEVSSIVLVAGKEDVDYCRAEIVEKYHFDKVVKVVAGGAERYNSVYEGLKVIQGADYVLIHDGARPMLEQEIIRRSMDAVVQYDACVVGMPVKDTIKISDPEGFCQSTPPRNSLWMIQTPQTFSYELVKSAYERVFASIENGEDVPQITDDAMMVEYATEVKVKLVQGDYENIKITTPEDLSIVSTYLKNRELLFTHI